MRAYNLESCGFDGGGGDCYECNQLVADTNLIGVAFAMEVNIIQSKAILMEKIARNATGCSCFVIWLDDAGVHPTRKVDMKIVQNCWFCCYGSWWKTV